MHETRLGDGYTQAAIGGTKKFGEEWDVRRIDTLAALNDFLVFFEQLAGVDKFWWNPTPGLQPYEDYLWTCPSWTRTPIGDGTWEIAATFVQEPTPNQYSSGGGGTPRFEPVRPLPPS